MIVRGPRSLAGRLVVTVAALVFVVTVIVAAVSSLGVRSFLTGQLDDEVTAALQRAEHAPLQSTSPGGDSAEPDGPNGRGDGPGPRGDIGDRRGQGVGTLTAAWPAGDQTGFGDVIVQEHGGTTSRPSLPTEALAALDELPADGQPRSVDLHGVGSYRVAVVRTPGGKIAAGLPVHPIDEVIATLVGWQALLVLAAAGLATAAGVVLIRRELRPLRQVAVTAHSVAEQPLTEGDVTLAQHVPDELTDQRTEVGRMGAALNTLLSHVETSLNARERSEQQVRQFVADASHELRTPLATIGGYVELARRHPDDTDVQQTTVTKVEEETRRMTSLVEDLLLLARLDAGRPLEQSTVDLTPLLVEAVSDARVLAPEHRWVLDLPDHVVEVTGDEHRLHQVVTNLLTNARKHTPSGTTVTVTGRPSGFTVHDDGPGIPPDMVDDAFERFVRGDSARGRAGGVGLGLALVDAIVRAHHGQVSLDSRPGSTSVTVTLADS